LEFRLYSISLKGIFFPKYTIESEGDLIYTVKRKGVTLMSGLGFYDEMGNELMTLKRKFALFKIQFELTRGDIHHAMIVLDRKNLKHNYIVDSPYRYYFVDGNLWMTEFTVTEDNDNEVAKISRKRRKKKNRYGIAMTEKADADLVLSLCIAIELTRRIKRTQRSGG